MAQTYYKVIGNNRNDKKYTLGIHTLDEGEKFNPREFHEGGGLYFTTLEHIGKYIIQDNGHMPYGDQIAILHLCNDSKVYKEREQYKTDKFNIVKIESVYDVVNKYCAELVAQNGIILKLVKNQTPMLCMTAFKQNEDALQYVHEQTPDLCLSMVQQHGFALKHVREQTPQMCMVAVQQHGCALMYVKKQTPEICLAAVKQNGYALAYVHVQSLPICMAAVSTHGWALQYVKEQTQAICMAAVTKNGLALQDVKEQTLEICVAAMKQMKQNEKLKDEMFKCVSEKYKKAVSAAIG